MNFSLKQYLNYVTSNLYPSGRTWLVLLSLIFSLVGCEALPFRFQPAATQAALTPEPTGTATLAAPTPTESPKTPTMLRLWLPPRFDPNRESIEGEVLRRRLEAFSLQKPDLELDVRIKAVDGAAGLLASLYAASVAAPDALPDVVALPRPLLEAAALKGVLAPLDGLTSPLDTADWYPYAVELGYVQERVFGLPFAADVLLLLSRAGPMEGAAVDATAQPTPTDVPIAQEASTPSPQLVAGFNWSELVEKNQTLAFPASDPQAMFTLLLYRAGGGALLDEEGRPFLDVDQLAQVLQSYQQAAQIGVLPAWLVQIDSDEQVRAAFASNQVDRIVTWISQYLAPADTIQSAQATPSLTTQQVNGSVPEVDGQPYTLATGWVWAISSPEPESRERALELVEFLADASFLAELNTATGYLPPRPDALEQWLVGSGETSSALRILAADLSSAASMLPSEDILGVLGPPVRQAVISVLNQQVEPEVAARTAVSKLSLP